MIPHGKFPFGSQLIPVVSYMPSTSSGPTTDSHTVNDQIYCQFGPSCPNYDTCPHLHPCRYGKDCRKSSRILQNTQNIEDLVHCKKCVHICKYGESCKQLKDEKHTEMFLHTCTKNSCKGNSEHKKYFRHNCVHGSNCHSLKGKFNNWEHFIKFIHPLDENVKKNIPEDYHYLFYNADSESKSVRRLSKLSVPTEFNKSSIKPVKKSDISGLDIVDKKNLKPQVKDRKRSAKYEIESISGKKTKYFFIGYEKGNGNTSTSNVVCFKDTEKGVFGGHIKNVAESVCEFPTSAKIYQPWFDKKVTVYRNTVISQVFDEILKKTLNGVSPKASYIDVMKYMINQHGIPIFIVGGAVRDVIREVIQDKNSNATQIMNNIKDIDIGFGCDPVTFSNLLRQQYTSGVQSPGPRGLVQVGSSQSSDLFLEGKAINGLNNDNRSVRQDIPQCYGTNLRGENICRDFTCNSLWYDPLNKCVIDTIGDGQGIKDALSKTLRIPVKEKHWNFWAAGNPTKLMRFYKFLLKGYVPADVKTKQFVIDQILSGSYTDQDLEIRNQYVKGIGRSHAKALEKLLKSDFGDTIYNSFFAKHIQ